MRAAIASARAAATTEAKNETKSQCRSIEEAKGTEQLTLEVTSKADLEVDFGVCRPVTLAGLSWQALASKISPISISLRTNILSQSTPIPATPRFRPPKNSCSLGNEFNSNQCQRLGIGTIMQSSVPLDNSASFDPLELISILSSLN